MPSPDLTIAIAVLDDYQNAARRFANWAPVETRASLTFFHDHRADVDAVIARLLPFDAVCVMRERTPLAREVLERLPRLKLIVSTGTRNAVVDTVFAKERGIDVAFTEYRSDPTIEMTWSLILGASRHLAVENASLRAGGWQTTVGTGLRGKTLGLLGLGRVGSEVARVGQAFGMNIITWSPHMTPERAAEHGATAVDRSTLFARSDVLSIHLVLGRTTRGLVGTEELALMRPDALLVNTSRGPLVQEAALVDALRARRLGGAALDVYDVEPLPADHPFRTLDNVLGTPHIGYVADDLYRTFYGDTVTALLRWLSSR